MTRIQDNDPSYSYDMIPAWPDGYPAEIRFFQHLPGIYCKRCGNIYALYSYSACQPHGLDENHKPYYNSCLLCNETEEERKKRDQCTEELRRQGQKLGII